MLDASIDEGQRYLKFRQMKVDNPANMYSKIQDTGIRGLDPAHEGAGGNGMRSAYEMSIGGQEGFTDFMGNTAVDAKNKQDRREVQQVEDDYNKSLSKLAQGTAQLMDDAQRYISVTAKGGNPYANKIVSAGGDGRAGYVTRYGEYRPLSPENIPTMKQLPGCQVKDVSNGLLPDPDSPITTRFSLPQMAEQLFVGPPIPDSGIPCGMEGKNVQYTMMADADSLWKNTDLGTKTLSGVNISDPFGQGANVEGCDPCVADGYTWCWKDRNCYPPDDKTSPCYGDAANCVSNSEFSGVYTKFPGSGILLDDSTGFTSQRFYNQTVDSCKEKCNGTPGCQSFNVYNGDDSGICDLHAGRGMISNQYNKDWDSYIANYPCKTSNCSAEGAQGIAGDLGWKANTDPDAFIGCVRNQGEGAYQTTTPAAAGGDQPEDRGITTSQNTKGLVPQTDMGTEVTREQCFTRALDIGAAQYGLGNAITDSSTGKDITKGICYTTDNRVNTVNDAGLGPGKPNTYTESYRILHETVDGTNVNATWGDGSVGTINYGVTRDGRFMGVYDDAFQLRVPADTNDLPRRVPDETSKWANDDAFNSKKFFEVGAVGKNWGKFKDLSTTFGGAFIPQSANYRVNSKSCKDPVDLGVPPPDVSGNVLDGWNSVGYPNSCEQIASKPEYRAFCDKPQLMQGMHNAVGSEGHEWLNLRDGQKYAYVNKAAMSPGISFGTYYRTYCPKSCGIGNPAKSS